MCSAVWHCSTVASSYSAAVVCRPVKVVLVLRLKDPTGIGRGQRISSGAAQYVQPWAVLLDDVAAAVGGQDDLHGDEEDVHEVPQKEEAQRAELEQAEGAVAEVEAVGAEEAEKDGEEEGHLEGVAVGVVAGDGEAHVAGRFPL